MITGIGTPSSQSKIPRPMMFSFGNNDVFALITRNDDLFRIRLEGSPKQFLTYACRGVADLFDCEPQVLLSDAKVSRPVLHFIIILHRNLAPIWNCFLRNVARHDLLQLLKRHWLNSIARGVFLAKEKLCFCRCVF